MGLSHRLWLRRALVAAIAVVLLAIVSRLLMPAAAHFLIRSDRLQHADAILILAGGRFERTLEAGSLYREGWAPLVILSNPSDEQEALLDRLGVHVPAGSVIDRMALEQMGVPRDRIINELQSAQTTRQEATGAAELARRRQFRRLIIVTSPYHARRATFLFRDAARGVCEIILRPARYQSVDPDRWWKHPADRYDVVMEYLKIAHEIIAPER